MYPELRTLLLWISRSLFDLDLFFDLKINLIFFRYPRGYLVHSGVDGSFDLGRNMKITLGIVFIDCKIKSARSRCRDQRTGIIQHKTLLKFVKHCVYLTVVTKKEYCLKYKVLHTIYSLHCNCAVVGLPSICMHIYFLNLFFKQKTELFNTLLIPLEFDEHCIQIK